MPNQLHGKKYRAAEKNREVAASYPPKQALEIVKKSAFAKFDETGDRGSSGRRSEARRSGRARNRHHAGGNG